MLVSLAFGLSKSVVVPMLDSPKCTTFGVHDTHLSTFLKSLSNVGISYLSNQNIQFTCCVGNKGDFLHNVCAHYTQGSHHQHLPWY